MHLSRRPIISQTSAAGREATFAGIIRRVQKADCPDYGEETDAEDMTPSP